MNSYYRECAGGIRTVTQAHRLGISAKMNVLNNSTAQYIESVIIQSEYQQKQTSVFWMQDVFRR